jgi:hypothetical protein
MLIAEERGVVFDHAQQLSYIVEHVRQLLLHQWCAQCEWEGPKQRFELRVTSPTLLQTGLANTVAHITVVNESATIPFLHDALRQSGIVSVWSGVV